MTEPVAFYANRYRATGLLGEGGMGQVYRVLDTLDGDRPLALKLIKLTGAATEEQRLRDGLPHGNSADAARYLGALARLFPEKSDDPAVLQPLTSMEATIRRRLT